MKASKREEESGQDHRAKRSQHLGGGDDTNPAGTFRGKVGQRATGDALHTLNAQYFPAEHFQGVLSADPLERGAICGKELFFDQGIESLAC
jgi:hypothetical protein